MKLRGSAVGTGFLYKPFPSTVMTQDGLEKTAEIDMALENCSDARR